MAVKFCESCVRIVENAESFCPGCGKKLTEIPDDLLQEIYEEYGEDVEEEEVDDDDDDFVYHGNPTFTYPIVKAPTKTSDASAEDRRHTFKIYVIVGLVIFFMIGALITGITGGSDSGGGSETCPICGKTFTYGLGEISSWAYKNAKSIRRKGLCESCYDNYEYIRDQKQKIATYGY